MRLLGSWYVPVILIVCEVIYGTFVVGNIIHELQLQQINAHAEIARVEDNKTKLSQALSQIKGLDPLDIATGFWYSYRDEDGNESVLYYDAENTARRADLDDTKIADIVKHVAKSETMSASTITVLEGNKLPLALQYHNKLYESSLGGTSTIEIEKEITSRIRKSPTSQALFELSYISEMKGDYVSRDALNAINCKKFGARCKADLHISIRGTVLDTQNNPVQGAKVTLVSRNEIPAVITDVHGAYVLSVDSMSMEKIRIRATKRNFSDGFAEVAILTSAGARKIYAVDDIHLETPITIVTVDYAHRTVTGEHNMFNPDGTVTIKTPRSTYQIPPGAIVGKDGVPYSSGPIDVYLYEFDKGRPPGSLMQLDTFDQVIGYAGNLMKTFGMPYIQFFTTDGVELEVRKSKPMVLTYHIANMQELRTNSDHIYQPLTESDMQFLVDASRGEPYRIDRQFLIKTNMLRFPAFWVFDRKRGIWDNIGVSVLNAQGTIQSLFYTVRDDI